MLLLIAFITACEQILCALVAFDSQRVTSFLKTLLNIHPTGVLTAPFGIATCNMPSTDYYINSQLLSRDSETD